MVRPISPSCLESPTPQSVTLRQPTERRESDLISPLIGYKNMRLFFVCFFFFAKAWFIHTRVPLTHVVAIYVSPDSWVNQGVHRTIQFYIGKWKEFLKRAESLERNSSRKRWKVCIDYFTRVQDSLDRAVKHRFGWLHRYHCEIDNIQEKMCEERICTARVRAIENRSYTLSNS